MAIGLRGCFDEASVAILPSSGCTGCSGPFRSCRRAASGPRRRRGARAIDSWCSSSARHRASRQRCTRRCLHDRSRRIRRGTTGRAARGGSARRSPGCANSLKSNGLAKGRGGRDSRGDSFLRGSRVGPLRWAHSRCLHSSRSSGPRLVTTAHLLHSRAKCRLQWHRWCARSVEDVWNVGRPEPVASGHL